MLGALFILLFGEGRGREFAIFITAFGVPGVPAATVYVANIIAQLIIEGKRKSSDFDEIDEQRIATLFSFIGLLLGGVAAAGCLYVLYISLELRMG